MTIASVSRPLAASMTWIDARKARLGAQAAGSAADERGRAEVQVLAERHAVSGGQLRAPGPLQRGVAQHHPEHPERQVHHEAERAVEAEHGVRGAVREHARQPAPGSPGDLAQDPHDARTAPHALGHQVRQEDLEQHQRDERGPENSNDDLHSA